MSVCVHMCVSVRETGYRQVFSVHPNSGRRGQCAHELTAGTTIVPWTNRRPVARPADPGWTEGPDRSGGCLALSSPGSAQPAP